MEVIAIASQKGGVGKSLLARAFAVAGLIEGKRAAIIDTDPQGNSASWGRRRPHPAPLVLTTEKDPLPRLLERLAANGAELVIIDTPPHAKPIVSLAVEHAGAVIVPVRPYPDDLEAVGPTVQIIRAAGKRAGIVLNATPARAQAVTLARGALATFGLPISPTALCDRVSHPYAIAEGLTAQEREPHSKAAEEVAAVWAWVRAVVMA